MLSLIALDYVKTVGFKLVLNCNCTLLLVNFEYFDLVFVGEIESAIL